jgi:hydroxymethylpyrimidine pyrophosphatase-like HAD family hydrolase
VSDWKPRLIATDMDGTLLRGNDTVSDATVAELERWRADGVPVVLATGRPPRWMVRIREVLRYGTAVCCNGAVLLDLAGFEVLEEDALEPEVLQQVTAELRRHQPDTWFAVEYGLEFRHEPVYQPRWDVDAPGVAVATLEEMVATPVAKLLARHETLPRDEFVALVERIVGDSATVTNSSTDALAEISARGVTKATGIARWPRSTASAPRTSSSSATCPTTSRRSSGCGRAAAGRWPWPTPIPTSWRWPPTSPAPTRTTASPPSSPLSEPFRPVPGRYN